MGRQGGRTAPVVVEDVLSEPNQPAWPVVSLEEARAILTAPGMPFEMETVTIAGRPQRVYKNVTPNLRAVFEASKQWASREFLIYEGERLGYDAHYRAVATLARALVERYGVKKGDRIAIAMRNLPEWSITFWASAVVGAVVTPLNAWGTGPDLEYGISDSEAKVAFVDAERLARLEPELPKLALAGLIAVRTPRDALGSADALEDVIGPPEGYASLSDQLPDVTIDPEDDATIFYTSGTTGRPKGAWGTHRNFVTNLVNLGYSAARSMVRRTGAPAPVDPNAPQRVSLLPVPFFHVTGCHSMLAPNIMAGGKIVLMYKWSPERALELIEQERVNGMTSVPAMVWQLMESPDFQTRDLSSFEGLTYGGAAAAPELTQKAKELFPASFPGQGYGATETSSVASGNAGEDYLQRPDSVGLPPPVNDIKIVGPESEDPLPIGSVGEICIYGPNVVKGYWHKPEATAAAFVDGWYHTGDVGRLDEDGFIYVMDRLKDMLIRGGENIYCVEIEDALYAHPAVMEAAVVGLPDRILGEVVGAVVRLRPGVAANEGELREHVKTLLAAHKAPVKIDIRHEELPRNASGKALKNVLRAEMLAAVKE
jgi:long-chain acyl-CoA synthetase